MKKRKKGKLSCRMTSPDLSGKVYTSEREREGVMSQAYLMGVAELSVECGRKNE